MTKTNKKQKAATHGRYHILMPNGKEYLVDWHVTDAYSTRCTPRLHLNCSYLNWGMSDDYTGSLPVSKETVGARVLPFAEAFNR